MPYPNDNRLNVVLMQTSASADGSGKFPFTERIISGSNLFILTDANGNLTGSTSIPGGSFTSLTVTSLTASFISASQITASNLVVVDNVILGSSTADYIQITGSTSISGSLTVVGNSILSNVFATNITASNISASGNISASTLRVETSIVDGGTLTVLGNTVLGDAITDTTRITGSTFISGSLTVVGNIVGTIDSASAVSITNLPNTNATYYPTFVDQSGSAKILYIDSNKLNYNPYTNALSLGPSDSGSLLIGDAALNPNKISLLSDVLTGATVQIGTGTGNISSSLTFGDITGTSGSFTVQTYSTPLRSRGVSTDLPVNASNSTQATSWNNGALTVAGGVGIGKNLYVSGSLNVIGVISASAISASSITSSVLIPITSSLKFIGSNISTYASSSTLGYFDSGNYGDFLIQSNDVPRVRIGGSTGNITFNNSNGNSILLLSTLTSSLYTDKVTIDASGSVEMSGDLAVNGGDITTTSAAATLFNTNASQVNIGGGAITQVLLGSAIGTVKSAGDFIVGTNIIKDSSAVTALTLTSTLTTVAGDLQVNGNDIKDSGGTNNLTLSSTRVNVPLTTQATDWTTGALTVAGGVGIGKNLYVSGSTFLYGDLTIYGTGSVVNISSSIVIIGDNRIQLNAGVPIQRYAGIDVFDSGSGTFTNNVTSSLLWDGLNDNWLLVSNNQLTGSPLTQSSAIMIGGPTGSFGNESLLTVNYIPKAQSTGKNLQNSGLSDTGTVLTYAGTGISASQVTSSQLTIAYTGSITYATGVYITYTTGSFTTITITTGSSPGVGAQVPSSPTANGLAGQINVDNNFIYVYTNQVWKRVPLSTWTA